MKDLAKVDPSVVIAALGELEQYKLLSIISGVLEQTGSEALKLIVDGLQIMQTKSAFRESNLNNLNPLQRALGENPLYLYLEQMDIKPSEAKRKHIIAWWDTLMQFASFLGYNPGGIDDISKTNNLWKATSGLALKMQKKPSTYHYLPSILINYSAEVTRVLSQISEPIPFIEILVGEAYEDMEKFPHLIAAMSTIKRDGKISQRVADGVLSIHMVLQRG